MELESAIQHSGYHFRALGNINLGRLTSKIINYYVAESLQGYWREATHFRGALLRLFGAPLQESELSDEAFDYVLEAKDALGQVLVLTAYQGPSGPAIGGKKSDLNVQLAAQALADLLRATLPMDYQAMLYDGELDWTVTYGVRNGEAFYQEVRGKHIPGDS
jgi:hypothetical protein